MQERKGLCSGQREESLTRGEGVQEEEQEDSVCVCKRVCERAGACECARRGEREGVKLKSRMSRLGLCS